MPRAIWSGSISFGLVNIPIKLYTAVSRKSVSFNQIDARTGARVKYQRVSAADGSEVPYDQIVKGYELSSGHYVTVTDEELASLDPEASRTIDIEEFVDLAGIDPLFYDAAYYVAPDKATVKPYALLVRAMEESGKVAIARFVMRTKQYLAALRPQDGKLVLSTMVYADEVVEPADIGEIAALDSVELSDRELAMARQLVESLSDEFQPEKYRDTHRDQVLELIERKAAGEEVVEMAPAAEAPKVVDLMAALEASVAAAKEARKRHPTSRASGAARDGEAAEDGEAPAKKAGAKKAAKAAPAPAAAADGNGAAKAPAKKAAAPRRRKSA
ncbi:MAG TPA: Ku protein [Acidimicrobiales bacterium]|jgi:DNA end-binding protein Ku